MRRIWTVARNEYLRHVARKRFIIVLLSPMLIMGISALVGYVTFLSVSRRDSLTTGVVDAKGALQAVWSPESPGGLRIFTSTEIAELAMTGREIGSIYILADDFASTGSVQLRIGSAEPAGNQRAALEQLTRRALVSGMPDDRAARALRGVNFRMETPDGSRVFDESSPLAFLGPLMLGLMFLVSMFVGSQYLMRAVVDEKENRTIEVLLSSLSPAQLLTGKILGLLAVTLTQVLLWLAAGFLLMNVASRLMPALNMTASLTVDIVLMLGALFLLQLLAYSALLAAIGSMVADSRQAQQLATPVVMAAIVPEFFIPALLLDPNGLAPTVLSLIPVTAPFTLAIRHGITSVPTWQWLAAFLLMLLFTAGALWVSVRIFHVGLLRFGQQIPWKEMLDALLGVRKQVATK